MNCVNNNCPTICLTQLSNKSMANRHIDRHTYTGMIVICTSTAELNNNKNAKFCWYLPKKCYILNCWLCRSQWPSVFMNLKHIARSHMSS